MSTPASSRCLFAHHAVKLPKLSRPRPRYSSSCRVPRSNLRGLASVQGPPGQSSSVDTFNGFTSHHFQEPGSSKTPPESRDVKLGRTLRTLQERLPTLLQSPLPLEILSPQITLVLFPSTHPHLPSVSGRVAYSAALWTSPIAWGRFPIVGNVRLEILSERMVKRQTMDNPRQYSSEKLGSRSEQLVVRWKTAERPNGLISNASQQVDKMKEFVSRTKSAPGAIVPADDEDSFTGLFIFEFDEMGRIVSHTIEHVQEGGNWERGVGAKVMGLTDWLLGGWKESEGGGTPCPAMVRRDSGYDTP